MDQSNRVTVLYKKNMWTKGQWRKRDLYIKKGLGCEK